MLSNQEEQTICCFGLFTAKVWTPEEIETSTYDNDHCVRFIAENGKNHSSYDGLNEYMMLNECMMVTSHSERLSKDRFMLHKVSYDDHFSIVLIYKKDKTTKKYVLDDGTVYVDDLQFKIKEQIVDSDDIIYVIYA